MLCAPLELLVQEQYNSEVVLSLSIQFYMKETVLLRGTEKRILNCEYFVSYIEKKMTEPKSQSQDAVIGIQKH